MNIKQLQNKKIAILGLGIENYALIKYLLKKKVKCEITICDKRDKGELVDKFYELNKYNVNAVETRLIASLHTRIVWKLEKEYNQGLDKFDILFRAPGWPKNCQGIKNAVNVGKELSSPMKLFFELCPTKNIIGVTGTKGKGTTSSLIYKILKKHVETRLIASVLAKKPSVFLGGNIGIAPFAFLDKIKKNDWVVLELSSFQLEDMTVSPHIAVITNFYSEHLSPADPNNPNYHKTLKEYWEAKANIFRWQKKGDYIIINSKFQIPNSKQISNIKIQKIGKGKKILFLSSNLKTSLPGEHNKENIAAAVEVAKIVGVKAEVIKKAVADFKGLEHRIEFVREINGVKYYDDSFATTPESTITALKSFSSSIVLLAGGADKGSSFGALAKEIKKRVSFVVLLEGKATPRLKKELLKAKFLATNMKIVYNIKEAVRLAKEKASNGDIILLSTACASFGIFRNYKERGDLFKNEINQGK